MKKATKFTIITLIFLIYTAMLLPATHAAGKGLSLYADVNLNEVADSLTAELFSQGEPSYALTKNIYFDPVLLPIPEGVDMTVTSSDSSVIEIVNVPASDTYGAYSYGKVYRDKYSDRQATVTVMLADSNETVTKEYDFNVVSLETKIYYSDTFRYEGYEGKFVQEVPGLKSTTSVRYTPSLTYGVGWQSLYETEFDNNSVDGRRFRTLLDKIGNNYCLRSERPFAAEEYNYPYL